MIGPLFIFPLLIAVCLGALWRPAIGVIGYYGFVGLEPDWNWRWSLPADFQYQKYIAIATLLGLLVTGLRGNRWTTSATLACVSLGIFLVLAFISGQSSIMPEATAHYLDLLWKIILMTGVAVHVLESPGWITAGMWTAVLSQGYNAYQINLDYLQRGYCAYTTDRSWGNKGDNNGYSIFTMPILAITMSLMFGSRPLWQKLLAGAVLVLQMHQIMLMESRGCMLGGLAMIPLVLWYMPQTKLNWSAVVMAVVLGGALAGPSVIEEFSSSFKPEGERDGSAESRFDVWRAGMLITADYPLLGVGPWAGQRLVPQYAELPGERKGLHNLIFEISTGCGVPALLFYLGFFAIGWWVALRALRRRKREPLPEWAVVAYLATVSGLVGYFVSSMFSSGAVLESSYMLTAFALATSLVLKRLRSEEPYLLMIEQDNLHETEALDECAESVH
jgi:hypothetical protein